MVTESPLERLRGKPREEKMTLAASIAIVVIIVLAIGWAIVFAKRLQGSGASQLHTGGIIQDDLDFNSANEAQQRLQNAYHAAPTPEMEALRDEVNSRGYRGGYGEKDMIIADDEQDSFFGQGGQ